ncbi:globin domain-containing protein [uncultured Pseudokineococcus sp.]|uniref:globin domain-containing protein n=1 Tax=uncultured Pseudokineococcus sp. TaxID=1642928 RepID=UPI002603EA8E|nr:globin domain-containing protein [uncultured Pseudokineococcus sp.]
MSILSPSSAEVVRATLPAVQAHGVQITTTFYAAMLSAHPELLRTFNAANQASGEQQQALAMSVVAYAEHLLAQDGDDAGPGGDVDFDRVMARIAHKHAALDIRPEQYLVVGRHLTEAVGEVLGDAVTAEVARAWDEVYWLFAVQLVAAEARLYQGAGVDPEDPWREWVVRAKEASTEEVTSFVLTPADGDAVPDFSPGQYVSVVVDLPDGRRQPRQYTLSRGPGRDSLRISVRRVAAHDGAPEGAVSTYLHDDVREGDALLLSEPFGEVVLDTSTAPLVLASAGVGITPMAAMLDTVARRTPDRQVVLVHADRSRDVHPLREEVDALSAQLPRAEQHVWYERPGADPVTGGGAVPREGFVDMADVAVPDGAVAYVCGPLPFMREVRAGLLRQGVPAERIHYEVFGPDLWAATGSAG